MKSYSVPLSRVYRHFLPPGPNFDIKCQGRILGSFSWKYQNSLEGFSPYEELLIGHESSAKTASSVKNPDPLRVGLHLCGLSSIRSTDSFYEDKSNGIIG